MENILNEAPLQYNYISAEEYLQRELQSTEKHEYYRGEIFAMGGASFAHNDIFSNLFGDIAHQLKGKIVNLMEAIYAFISLKTLCTVTRILVSFAKNRNFLIINLILPPTLLS